MQEWGLCLSLSCRIQQRMYQELDLCSTPSLLPTHSAPESEVHWACVSNSAAGHSVVARRNGWVLASDHWGWAAKPPRASWPRTASCWSGLHHHAMSLCAECARPCDPVCVCECVWGRWGEAYATVTTCVHLLCLQTWYHLIKSCTCLVGLFSFKSLLLSLEQLSCTHDISKQKCWLIHFICPKALVVLIGLLCCAVLPSFCLFFNVIILYIVSFIAQLLSL